MVLPRREVLVQLDDELGARLDGLAKSLGTNRSEFLRRGAQAVLAAEVSPLPIGTWSLRTAVNPPTRRSCNRPAILPPASPLRGNAQRDLLGPTSGRRQAVRAMCVLTRDAAASVLAAIVWAPITRTFRGIRSEVSMGVDEGLPEACVIMRATRAANPFGRRHDGQGEVHQRPRESCPIQLR